ncbi:S-phase kinase-associated protein 2-like [Choristoneura fumiferana]
MPSLQYLEVWGMLQTASLNALRAALPAIQVNQFMFSAIARPTVGARRTSIWGLRTRDYYT